MWRALRTELVYFVPWLLGGLGIAAFVVVVLSVLLRFLEEGDGPPVFVAAMMPVIAGMVVSFIALGYRSEERRARLLLAGDLTPRKLAGVTVLLPLSFVGVGTLAAAPMIGLADLISGRLEPASLMVVIGFAGQFLAYAQLGPLAQESAAARRQGRGRAAVSGWIVFVAVILVLATSQFVQHSIAGFLGVALAVIAAMAVAARLYLGRTDFTR
jgi:hypothetical protein